MVKISLADDHQVSSFSFVMIIENPIVQVQVHEAWDDDSAVKNIKVQDYDLIVLDVKMLIQILLSYLLSTMLTYKPWWIL